MFDKALKNRDKAFKGLSKALKGHNTDFEDLIRPLQRTGIIRPFIGVMQRFSIS